MPEQSPESLQPRNADVDLGAETLLSAESKPASSSLQTLPAPSFAAPAPTKSPGPLRSGDRIGDFVLLRELGKGGFATVFLAEQVSLGRQVALKVGPNRGHEAQTLASLEHDHIVHVFSETVDVQRQIRLLCMQYVSGCTLQEVLRGLSPAIREGGSGRDFLGVLDQVNHHVEQFRPTALQERESLASSDFYGAVCWLGARLANALEFAHQQGVLHRDIKPANILINAYGRPFLADFNLATSVCVDKLDGIGGTFAYMSPEQARAFFSKAPADLQAVDARSDLYSLGVVLFEMTVGHQPFTLDESMDESRPTVAPLLQFNESIPECLDQVIRRCLAIDPQHRFQSATELRQALESCRQQTHALQHLPPRPFWAGFFHARPFLSLLLLSLVPNLIGSVVNVSYNFIHIVDHLTQHQQIIFNRIVLAYNLTAYPILVGITCFLLIKAHRDWKLLRRDELLPAQFLSKLTERIHFLSTWSIVGTCLGWLPGGLIFPLAINWFAEPLGWETFIHFFISFTLSGLIAVTYCFLGTQYVVVRVLFPRLAGLTNLRKIGGAEQIRCQIHARLTLFQVLAGVIPLAGALLLVLSGPVTHGDFAFRLLLAALILLGMVGFTLAMQISSYLTNVCATLTGNEWAE